MAGRRGSAPERGETRALTALVRQPKGTPGRALAFAELVEAAPRTLTATLKALAADPQTDLAMRSKAVAALARSPTPGALEGLRAAAGGAEPLLARRAIERLGKVGTPEDVALVAGLDAAAPATRRVARAAELFLSYRHGLGEKRHDSPGRRFAADPARAAAIRIAPLTGAAAEKRRALTSAPGVELAATPPLEMVCGKRRLTVWLTRDAAPAAALAERQAIPAVVTEEDIESGYHEPVLYLMTDPGRAGRIVVTGVRPSGRVTLAGTGTLGEGRVAFELAAVRAPHQTPFTLQGEVVPETGAFTFGAALVEPLLAPEQQARRRAPKPQAGPLR